MRKDPKPFATSLDLNDGHLGSYNKKVGIHLSDLKEYFSDKRAINELLGTGANPLIYEYYEFQQPPTEGHLNFGVTRINPGKIGDEYHLTRGHYHARENAAEIYIGIKGEGLLLMQKEKEFKKMRLKCGVVEYVPPFWAHRAINIGNEKLCYFYVYPADAGHKYGTIKDKGFMKLVREKKGKLEIVDNPQFSI